MAKINVLEPSVFNKIAAGEVVERPSSVVKELIENSIDAGASVVDISIINGGISFIEVSDNGVGIENEEILKAFLPHATSKVSSADDLSEILTLGFRGEALASIAAVSEVTMTTKTKDEELGTEIKISGGEVVEQKQVGAPTGTRVQVRNLFYNIPVRYKFLKKPKQEEMAVSEIVSRLVLANPQIAFKYVVDGKIVYQSNGEGLENSLYSVYGSSVMKNVIPLEYHENDVHICGFIGKPTFTKPNSTYQTIVINGRYVNSRLISTAVGRVYEDYMMTRAYPFFVLHFEVPIENVDVNVHPNKLEIRFKDQQLVFGATNHAVDKTLLEFRTNSAQNDEETSRTVAQTTNLNNQEQTFYNQNISNVVFESHSNTVGVYENKESTLNEIVLEKNKVTTDDNGEQFNRSTNEIEAIKTEPEPVLQQGLFDGFSKNFELLSIKIVGKIFNTFIIVEIEDKVYLIDQHAAHERILYDKLVAGLKRGEHSAQPLFVPYVLETNNLEHQFINENIENLIRLGFDIEEFGNNSFKISTVPYNLPDLDLKRFFDDVLKNVNTILNLKNKDLMLDKLAQTACKHAVKGGDDLSKEEIVNLLEDLARSDIQLQCPHGRPFVVEFSRYEIDKWFKRVL